MKNKKFYLLILIIVVLVINAKISLNGATRGLLLWFNIIIPTLLPFMSISNLIQNIYGSVIKHPTAYIMLVGLLCGYPLGAFSTVSLYKQNRISQKQAYLLLTFCNISSPSFVISYISLSCLKYNEFPLDIILLTYLPVAVGLIIIFLSDIKNRKNTVAISKDAVKYPVINLEAIDVAVTNSINNILKLGVYIIIFSTFAAFINELPIKNQCIRYILIGSTEITTAINCIAESTLDYNQKLPLILVINAFGGLSCCVQSSMFFKDSDISTKKYMYGKLVLAALTMVTWLIYVHVF
ncbi:MAG: hypothetical protein ACI4GD_08015 [Lachnospiraceae bacterium]